MKNIKKSTFICLFNFHWRRISGIFFKSKHLDAIDTTKLWKQCEKPTSEQTNSFFAPSSTISRKTSVIWSDV